MIHEQRKKLPENVSNNENEAQHHDRKQNVHDQLAANESIDQLHFLAQMLAQTWQEGGTQHGPDGHTVQLSF